MTEESGSRTDEAEVEVVDEREAARRRIQIRRDFGSHVAAYVVFNVFMVAIWAITGAGYFWPIWIMALWGIGLVMHAWDVFWRRPVTDADIDAEVARRRR